LEVEQQVSGANGLVDTENGLVELASDKETEVFLVLATEELETENNRETSSPQLETVSVNS